MNKFLFIVFFSLIATCSYAANDMDIQRMKDDISRLSDELNTMQKQFYRSNNSSPSSSSSGQSSGGFSDDGQQPEEIEEQMRSLNGKIEELEFSINTLGKKVDKIIADIDYRLQALEKASAQQSTANSQQAEQPVTSNASTTPTTPVPAPTTPAPAVSSNAQGPFDTSPEKPSDPITKEYDAAFKLLSDGKYPESEKAFKAFVEKYKDNDLTGNAYYWLGESFYKRANYKQSAVYFLKGYQDFKDGNKAPDNLFKLSMSLAKLGKNKESCATFDKLKSEYPNAPSDLNDKIKQEKGKLKC